MGKQASKGPLREYRCHGCGRTFQASSSNAVRDCSKGCRDQRVEREAAAAAGLEAAGFSAHPKAGNVWVKDGYAITVDEVRRGGLELALGRQARWTAARHA